MADLKDNMDNNAEKAQDIKTATRTNFFQRMAARFGFTVVRSTEDKNRKNKKNSTYKIIQKPTSNQLLNKDEKEELDLIGKLVVNNTLSTTVQDLFDEWVEDTQNTYANITERQERLNAFTYMCDNEGIVKSAVTLVASEVASLSEDTAFSVISEDKNWQDEINFLLKDVWNLDQSRIYSLAWNLFLYGEAFLGKEVTSAGVVGLNNVSVNEILERLEFKPSKVAEFCTQMKAGNGKSGSTGFTVNLATPTNGGFGRSNLDFNVGNRQVAYTSRDELLRNYIENIAEVSSVEYFTPHLLGYRIYGDQLVAPWQVSHFRFNANVSEFWPYGQPPLIACLSAYKMLQRVMGLDDLEKLLSMPIHLYKVKTNGATVGRAFDIVNTVKERYENVGLVSGAAGIEGPSLATNIWTSDDLVSMETVQADKTNDSSATDKMRFFNSRLTTATGIPMSYIDPSAEGFQMSGVALSTLFKPFRTLVENLRGIISAEIEDTIRLHDSIRGVSTPAFTLSMNVINPVATEDTSSKLELADTIMDTVALLLGLDGKEALPKTVKKDILTKYADFSVTDLESYEHTLEEEGEATSKASDEELDADFGEPMDSEDTGDEEDLGESVKRAKKTLIQERYNVAKRSVDLKYYLTEAVGTLKMRRSVNHFSSGYTDKLNEEMGTFLSNRPKRKGKKRIQS